MRSLGSPLRWQVWTILAVALVLRLGAGELISDRIDPGTDPQDYERIGLSLAAGDGYPLGQAMAINGGPSAFRPPGQPYLLAGVFAVSGDSRTAVRVVQALLGTLTVGLLGILAWQVFRRRDIALAAMVICAAYVPLIAIGVPPMSETLFFAFAIGSLNAAMRFRESELLRWAFLAGALAALALLTRAAGVLVILPVLLLLIQRPLGLRGIVGPATALVATCLVLAPWTIRNAIEFDALVPVSTQGGISVGGAYNNETRADPAHFWRPPQSTADYEDLFQRPGLDEAELSRELTDRSLDFIKDDPLYLAEFAWDNLGRMLGISTRGPRDYDAQLMGFASKDAGTTTFRAIFYLGALSFVTLLILTAWTIARRHATPIPWQLWLIAVIAIVLGSLLAGAPRYRLPADLILMLSAAPAAVALFELVRARLDSAKR